jgi:hypothetical protein
MQLLPIINQVGPLPIKVQFKAPVDGPAVLVVSGTLWANTANTPIQMTVFLDGAQVGVSQLWSNQTGEHRTLPTSFLSLNLTYGEHQLALFPGGTGVVSDLNDNYSAALIY